MYNGRHISFKRVLYRAMKHPNASDLTEEQAAEYAFELIRNLQIAFSFKDEYKYSKIKNYRIEVPEDLIFIKGVRFSLDEVKKDNLEFDLNWVPVKYTGNIYHSNYHCKDYTNVETESTVTYNINNNYIYFSEPDGYVQISYRGLILDKDGYPMIPDDQSFENALYYYILKEHFFPLLGIGKISQYFYEKIEQDYAWYVAQAQNQLKLSGIDHWESTMNGIRRLIQYQNFSDYGFKELHRREQIKKRF